MTIKKYTITVLEASKEKAPPSSEWQEQVTRATGIHVEGATRDQISAAGLMRVIASEEAIAQLRGQLSPFIHIEDNGVVPELNP